MTQIFQPLLLQSMGLPWRLWRIFSPNGTVVALCKSLTMVMMLIPLISSWRCLYSSLSMLMDNRPLQLPHIIWRKRNNLQWLESSIYWKSLDKRNKGTRSLGSFYINWHSKWGSRLNRFYCHTRHWDRFFFLSKNDDDDNSEDDDNDKWVHKNEEPINNIFDLKLDSHI